MDRRAAPVRPGPRGAGPGERDSPGDLAGDERWDALLAALSSQCSTVGARLVWGYWPTRPSIRSRSRSAWPRWRAYSSIMWSITSRSATVVPSCMGLRMARSGEPATNCSAKATSSRRTLEMGVNVKPGHLIHGNGHMP